MKKGYAIVDGRELKVLDRLGFSHSNGKYAIEVQDGDRERIATSANRLGPWAFHTVAERIAPLFQRKSTP